MAPTQTPGTSSGRQNRTVGAGGRKLSAAFDAVSSLPALAEARERLVGQVSQQAVSPGELVETIESDAGLAIAVIKAANNGKGPPGRTAGIQQAIEALSSQRVAEIADRIETYELLGAPGSSEERYERFRRHAVAVRAAADRIAEETRFPQRDELSIAALLHDVGRMVIGEMYGAEFGSPSNGEEPPEERVRRERRELGIDHALVGAVLVRRWGLPAPIAAAIERHHSPEATGLAGYIRLADLVVHHAAADRVHPESLRDAATRLGLEDEQLRALVFRYPHAGETRRRASEPCPLSAREVDALRGLAEGKVYKQIAQELSLSVSTVRTHLHNVYRKIGAVDRAQAVLLARDRGWI
jgi:putative nucleotidyltransferase with HDIG domain